MAVWSFITVLIVNISLFSISFNVNADKHNSTFIPSNQWKKVEEGQTLPAGLHVRINLHTGEKEAKLPDPEGEKKSLMVTPENNKDSKNEEPLDPDKLKILLKNIKSDDGGSGKIVRGKLRSYEKLKEDFSKFNLEMRTDVEILTSLVESFKKLDLGNSKDKTNKSSDLSEDEEILIILFDLEYLVHQYDNAQEFAKLNGFSDVIYASLNSSSSEVRSEALRLLGSATQSNPKVQIAAMNSGAIHLLLKILTFDEDINVRSRSIYALSCLIRRFPTAQEKLIADGGLTAFAKVFDEEKQDLSKLQVKIMTLLHDLLFERIDTKMNLAEEERRNQTDSKADLLEERLEQYKNMNLEKKLVEQEWCSRIPEWFVKQNLVNELNKNTGNVITLESVNLESHDFIEKVIDTVYVLSDICMWEFQADVDFLSLLFTLEGIYSKLAEAEASKSERTKDSNQLYIGVWKTLTLITERLKGVTKRDEL